MTSHKWSHTQRLASFVHHVRQVHPVTEHGFPLQETHPGPRCVNTAPSASISTVWTQHHPPGLSMHPCPTSLPTERQGGSAGSAETSTLTSLENGKLFSQVVALPESKFQGENGARHPEEFEHLFSRAGLPAFSGGGPFLGTSSGPGNRPLCLESSPNGPGRCGPHVPTSQVRSERAE